jgi:hypothetical protein
MMSTPCYTIYGIDMDIEAPEGTPEYGEGEVVMLYVTVNEDGSPHYCRYLFKTDQKMFAHEQQVRQIKDAADEAN